MRRIACWINLLLLSASGCNQATPVEFGPAPRETLVSIAGLKAMCDAQTGEIDRDVAIRGDVVANDLYGEFFHQIVLQDDSGGICISIDGTDLYKRFPTGTCVEVRCNGLVLYDYGGKVELGSWPDDTGTGEIPEEEIDRYLRTSSSETPIHQIATRSFGEIGPQHIDTHVRFDRVRFADTGKCWCERDPETGQFLSTDREIIDREGNRFRVRTLWCCEYADAPLPEGEGSLLGVIDYFGGEFSLRVASMEVLFPQRSDTDDAP